MTDNIEKRIEEKVDDFISDVSVDSDQINESLWYVNPKDLKILAKIYLKETREEALREVVEKNYIVIRKTKPKKGLPNGAYVAFTKDSKKIFAGDAQTALKNLLSSI